MAAVATPRLARCHTPQQTAEVNALSILPFLPNLNGAMLMKQSSSRHDSAAQEGRIEVG